MKRILIVLLVLCCLIPQAAMAAEENRSYVFSLASNGEHDIRAETGELITVSLKLNRTDSTDAADMYAMQDEIIYDSTFFELVEGSMMTKSGLVTNDISIRGTERALYVNFLSVQTGETWNAEELLCTFQMKVIGKKGTGVLQNSSYLISTSDGTDTYEASDQNLAVRVGRTVNWMLILVIVLCLLLLLLLLLLLRRKKKEPKK